jgi:methyl-accepting chemotaxis protein
MRIFQIFSLRRLSGRISLAFIFLVMLILINGLATFYFVGLANDAKDQEVQRLSEYTNLRQFNSLLTEQTENVYILVEDKLPVLISAIRKQQVNLEEVMRYTITDFDKGSAMGMVKSIAEKHDQVQRDFDAILKADILQGGADKLLRDSETVRRQLFDELDMLLKNRETALNDARQQSRDQLNTTINFTALIIIISTILALVLTVVITRMFSRPLRIFQSNLEKMAEGDLTSRFAITGPEEIATLGVTMNRAVARLRLVMSRIQSQAANVSTTSLYLERSSTEQASSLSQQAVAVAEVSATVGELSGTSQQIADSASLVASSAGEALKSAELGFNTMVGASRTMSEIGQRVNQIADRIIALNVVSQRIREAITLISTLSDDTHLLALNAAIESAGAGEEGARFAVVAAQVRKLAQRSRVAAVEIQQLVSQIQQATTASVMATEEGIKVAAVGQEMVEKSLMVNQEIIGLVQQTSQLAQAISMATGQQRLANSQVAETMHELARIISSISTNSQQYMVSSNDLTEVANQLNILVNTFKIHESAEEQGQLPEQTIEAARTIPVS